MNLTCQIFYWLASKLMEAAERAAVGEEKETFMDAAEALQDAADLIMEMEGD